MIVLRKKSYFRGENVEQSTSGQIFEDYYRTNQKDTFLRMNGCWMNGNGIRNLVYLYDVFNYYDEVYKNITTF